MRHVLNDRRSLALNEWVAAHLDDAMVERARQRLQRWTASGVGIHPERARLWQELLDGDRADLLHVLTSDDQRSAMLRLDAPFAGEMPPRERAELWRRMLLEWQQEFGR